GLQDLVDLVEQCVHLGVAPLGCSLWCSTGGLRGVDVLVVPAGATLFLISHGDLPLLQRAAGMIPASSTILGGVGGDRRGRPWSGPVSEAARRPISRRRAGPRGSSRPGTWR